MYSTCTLSPEENEAVVHMLLSLYPELEIQDINIDYKYAKK
jgi:16S rRNA C967 or C1407 C5-methylase (RsmB/RsmF family)